MPKKKRMQYERTFKLEVLRDYYSSGLSLHAISKKWGLSDHTVLIKWKHQYPVDSELLSLDLKTVTFYSKMSLSQKSKGELLEEEVLRLKKALEMEKLRSRAFEKLLELTEEEEGIKILKKAGAKQ